MNDFKELLLQNNVEIFNSTLGHAKKDGYLETISYLELALGVSVDNISRLIIAANELDDFNDFNILVNSIFNIPDYNDGSPIDITILLTCLKYYRYSYISFINSCGFSNDITNNYFKLVSRLFDSLEIHMAKVWHRQFNDPALKKDSNERYLIVVESSLNPIIIIDKDSKIVDMNNSARKLFFELNEAYFFEGNVNDTLPWLINNYEEFIRGNNGSYSFEQAFHTKKGVKYYDIKLVKTSTFDGKRSEVAIVMNNITGYKKMAKEISDNKLRYQSLFKNMFDSCTYNKLIVDDNNIPVDFIILDVNDALIKSLGMKRDEIIGRKGSEIFSFLNVPDFNWLNTFGKAALNGENIRIKELYLESVKQWYSISIYSSEDGYFVFVYSDITEKKLAEENVIKLAYYDILTGLPNGKHLDDRIKDAIAVASDTSSKFAVMFIDISNFKKINNTLGHKTGDAVLQQIALRFKSICGYEDTVARLGGDKFVILHKNIGNAEDVSAFAENITESLESPFSYNDHEFYIKANIGISIYPDDANNMHTLKRNADTAMFVAKNNIDLRYKFHTKDMNDKALKNLIMEADLRKAIQKNELILHYQPLMDIKTRTIVGLEALIRWNKPKYGMIYPNEFIPIAEDNGLIIPIGEWVLYTACKQCKEWKDNEYPDIYVAVNISIHQLESRNFIDKLKQILLLTELDAKHLCIEITEGIYMDHIEEIYDTLIKLKEMGIKISLDNFGAGHSSINHLSKLPINTLKIDRSFISSMGTNREYSIIIKAIVKTAHSLNINVVAEGVETEDELNILRRNKCDNFQGYLVSRPVSPESVRGILIDNKN